MDKHQILFFQNIKGNKNLNSLCLLYKQSNNLIKVKHKPSTKFFSIFINNFLNYDLLNDKIIYYNRDIPTLTTTTENIRDSIINRLISIERGLSYMTYLYKRMWSLNRLTFLSMNFYLKNGKKKMVAPNRIKKDPNLLLKKLYKYIRYKKKRGKLTSYWQYPIKYRYKKKINRIIMYRRNNFNRVLVNNLINLFCSGHFRIFFNIFRHFTKLISKRIMFLYLNDYNFFNFFIKKKYNKFTIKWFKIFPSVSNEATDKLFYTNYIRPTMLRKITKLNLIQLYRKRQTYMYSWLYTISIQEVLKNFDLKLFYIIKYIYLMRGKRYKRIFQRSRRLAFSSPISNKKFLIEVVNVFCISMRTKDPKFIFDFLFKYFNTMYFRMQFRFISFLKSFIRHNFALFVDYYKIRGLRILIKGKIGKTGSVRKKKVLLSFGKIGYSNLRLRMDESVGPMFTPTGVIGARIIITY